MPEKPGNVRAANSGDVDRNLGFPLLWSRPRPLFELNLSRSGIDQSSHGLQYKLAASWLGIGLVIFLTGFPLACPDKGIYKGSRVSGGRSRTRERL